MDCSCWMILLLLRLRLLVCYWGLHCCQRIWPMSHPDSPGFLWSSSRCCRSKTQEDCPCYYCCYYQGRMTWDHSAAGFSDLMARSTCRYWQVMLCLPRCLHHWRVAVALIPYWNLCLRQSFHCLCFPFLQYQKYQIDFLRVDFDCLILWSSKPLMMTIHRHFEKKRTRVSVVH